MTPSDEVDQVWHLHLLYSRHYWDALCRDTLETPLHHGPTQGGAAEDRKFHDWYEATLAAYRRYFGEPPQDLWPAAGERFDEHHDFVRIDRRDVMTLDRALLRRGAIATLSGGGALAIANALAQADGADAPGTGSGLWLIIPAILIAMIVVVAFRAGRRRGGTRKSRKGGSAAAAAATPVADRRRKARTATVTEAMAAAPPVAARAGCGGGGGGGGCGGGRRQLAGPARRSGVSRRGTRAARCPACRRCADSPRSRARGRRRPRHLGRRASRRAPARR